MIGARWTRRAGLALVLAIAVFGGASIAVAGSLIHHSGVRRAEPPRGRAASEATVPAWVAALAQRIATQSGDPNPSEVRAVATTRQAANRVAGGDIVDTDPPVYLVAMRGAFTDRMAFVPDGAPFPSGSVVTFTADAATRGVLDYGIGDDPPALQALGTAARVTLPHSHPRTR